MFILKVEDKNYCGIRILKQKQKYIEARAKRCYKLKVDLSHQQI